MDIRPLKNCHYLEESSVTTTSYLVFNQNLKAYNQNLSSQETGSILEQYGIPGISITDWISII